MPNGENRDDIIIIPVFLCSGSGSLSLLFTAIVIVFATILLEHQQKKQYNKDKQK